MSSSHNNRLEEKSEQNRLLPGKGNVALSFSNPLHRVILNFTNPQVGFNELPINVINALYDNTELNDALLTFQKINNDSNKRIESARIFLKILAELVNIPDLLPVNQTPKGEDDPADSIAKTIAELFYQEWLINFSLGYDDAYKIIRSLPEAEKIIGSSLGFLDLVNNTIVDKKNNLPLAAFLPAGQSFILMVLHEYGRSLALAIREIESSSKLDPRLKIAKQLRSELGEVKLFNPQDGFYLNQVIIQTNDFLKNPKENLSSYEKLANQIAHRSWGKKIAGAMLALVGITLLALCCATGVGAVAVPVLAWGLSYLVSGAVLGSVLTGSGWGLFAKGKQENNRTAELGREMQNLVAETKEMYGQGWSMGLEKQI
ncbi:MAG TPA: hypothetical protein VHA13_00170 [Gammaproteobacteria bacterium]|nr:hypothetical protein [Gammaproteobacteria bacterium]